MGDTRLSDIAKKMRGIDFAMLMTFAPGGQIGGRPMSNNRQVEFNGETFFFTRGLAQMVRDIERNPQVAISYQGRGMFGGIGVQINVQGTARVLRDKGQFRPYWHEELKQWFKQGIDTPGLVMIRVQAKRVNYWDGKDSTEILLGT